MKSMKFYDDNFDVIEVKFQPDCLEYWTDEDDELELHNDKDIKYAYHVKVYRKNKLLIDFNEKLYYDNSTEKVVDLLTQYQLTDQEASMVYNHMSSLLYDLEFYKNYTPIWLINKNEEPAILN